jgi:hypothetical protein
MSKFASQYVPEFAHTHAALFDELERQGIYRVDVVKLTRAVLNAQAIIAKSTTCATTSIRIGQPTQRCETCE